MPDYTLTDQIKCIRRELALRKSTYLKLVAAGQMKQEDAAREFDTMQAVHDTLVEAREFLTEPSSRTDRIHKAWNGESK